MKHVHLRERCCTNGVNMVNITYMLLLDCCIAKSIEEPVSKIGKVGTLFQPRPLGVLNFLCRNIEFVLKCIPLEYTYLLFVCFSINITISVVARKSNLSHQVFYCLVIICEVAWHFILSIFRGNKLPVMKRG